jgi:DNA replication protein DnaC
MEITAEMEKAQKNLLEKRRRLGISETEKPIQSISKLVIEEVLEFAAKNVNPEDHFTLDGCPHDGCVCIYCEGVRKDMEREASRLFRQHENPLHVLMCWEVPPKHIHSSFETFQGADKVKDLLKEAVKNKSGVILSGKTGCGKTHLGVAMLRHIVETSEELFKEHLFYEKPEGLFASVSELLLEIRSSFKKSDDSELELVEKYTAVPLLLLDDLGAEKATEWVESTLYVIIDRRNRDMKWTIVTSNLGLEEIEQHLGARIASRLSDMKVVKLNLPDWRKKR